MANESLAVTLARDSLKYFVETGKILPAPAVLPVELEGQAGVFVSLKKHGNLRGCIGTFQATRQNKAVEIIYNAISAGTEDPRFPPVQISEIDDIVFSVDILGQPESVESLEQLDVQKYGVIVRRGRKSGLLLPMLEGVDSVEEQVGIAMQKAGISPHEEIELYRFTVTRYY